MTESKPPTARLASVDAYRGLVMFLMMAEVLRLSAVARALPENPVWRFLAYHQSHVEWVGCSLHDLIQPSFTFLVGVSLPFSLASRQARGQSLTWMTAHAFWRSLVLILLGVFLRSVGRPQTYWTFEDTLTQIGLGYWLLFLIALGRPWLRWVVLGIILVGYWGMFAIYPAPGPDFNWPAVGVPPDWPHHLSGFAAHWDKNSNAAWAIDNLFLNLFPREKPFLFNGGGYATASFYPTLGTMILGLIAGDVLRNGRSPWEKARWLAVAGLIALAAGWTFGAVGVCPVVKRIWTPSWVLFSGGWCFLLLAGFYAVVDIRGWKGWAFPLVVVGANSIAAYVMDHLFVGFIRDALKRHLGVEPFRVLGSEYEPLLLGAAVLGVLWLILFWMYRRRIFVKI
jgi:heparan-alpha-glucosaminide N-acetyltransferase